MRKPKSAEIFVAGVIYRAAVAEEKEWRNNNKGTHDIIIMDQLLKQVRKLGYHYKYFADITNRENNEKIYLNCLSEYIGRFQDEYFSAALVGVVGQKGNRVATEAILKSYIRLSDEGKHNYAAFYDNALSRIKDRRYLPAYLELLNVPEDAIRLPLTMIMLGKWQIEEAKPYFLKYLNADILYHNKITSDLVYISLEALSCYQDTDGVITSAFEDKLKSNDKNLVCIVKKAIKRVCEP